MLKENSRKRINVFVDVETYGKLRRILSIIDITFTDFLDNSMSEFIKSMETIVENDDKDSLLQVISKNLNFDKVLQELKK